MKTPRNKQQPLFLALSLLLVVFWPGWLRPAWSTQAVNRAEEAIPLATTEDIIYNVVFETSGQSMWGPGSSVTPEDKAVPIVSTAWNASSTQTDIRDVAGSEFGGAISGSTSGKFDVAATFHDFEAGSVDVYYPIEVTLTKPTSVEPGQPVTFTSNWRLLPGASISALPTQGHLDITGTFELNAAANATVCVFDCTANLPFFPPIDTPEVSATMLAIDSTEQQTIDPITADLTGVSGSFGLPNVPLSSTVAANGRSLLAGGVHNNFVDLTADLDEWAGYVCSTCDLLGEGVPDFGVGVEASYDIWDITTNLEISQRQQFVFTPTLRMTLQFSEAVQFTIRDEAGTIIDAGLSSSVMSEVGQHIEIIPSPDSTGFSVTPTFALANTFSNETTTTFTQDLRNEVLALTLKTPSVEVIPEVCVPVVGCTPAVYSPQVSIVYGPLFTHVQPLHSTDDTSLFDGDQPPWELSGFRPVTRLPFWIGDQKLYLPTIKR